MPIILDSQLFEEINSSETAEYLSVLKNPACPFESAKRYTLACKFIPRLADNVREKLLEREKQWRRHRLVVASSLPPVEKSVQYQYNYIFIKGSSEDKSKLYYVQPSEEKGQQAYEEVTIEDMAKFMSVFSIINREEKPIGKTVFDETFGKDNTFDLSVSQVQRFITENGGHRPVATYTMENVNLRELKSELKRIAEFAKKIDEICKRSIDFNNRLRVAKVAHPGHPGVLICYKPALRRMAAAHTHIEPCLKRLSHGLKGGVIPEKYELSLWQYSLVCAAAATTSIATGVVFAPAVIPALVSLAPGGVSATLTFLSGPMTGALSYGAGGAAGSFLTSAIKGEDGKTALKTAFKASLKAGVAGGGGGAAGAAVAPVLAGLLGGWSAQVATRALAGVTAGTVRGVGESYGMPTKLSHKAKTTAVHAAVGAGLAVLGGFLSPSTELHDGGGHQPTPHFPQEHGLHQPASHLSYGHELHQSAPTMPQDSSFLRLYGGEGSQPLPSHNIPHLMQHAHGGGQPSADIIGGVGVAPFGTGVSAKQMIYLTPEELAEVEEIKRNLPQFIQDYAVPPDEYAQIVLEHLEAEKELERLWPSLANVGKESSSSSESQEDLEEMCDKLLLELKSEESKASTTPVREHSSLKADGHQKQASTKHDKEPEKGRCVIM